LKDAADDLQTWVYQRQDVVRVEPEVTKLVIEARDKAYKKLREVTEREPRESPKF
jgi:hypothetical protein